MERKKRAAGGTSRRRKASPRKRKSQHLKQLRVNLILAAAIFGISAGIFVIRFDFFSHAPVQSGTAPVASVNPPPQEPAVSVPSDTSPLPPAPEKPASVKPEAGIAGNQPLPVEKPSSVALSPEKPPVRVQHPRLPSVAAPASPPPEKPHPVKHRGTLIFVFDDAGHNLRQLEPFLKLPFPCTIAVLPGLEYSREAAQKVRAAGKEVILHQPMQAINLSIKPGPGAITAGMTSDQIKATVRKNLAEVGPVSGMNNHEGSLITADKEAMRSVLAVAREKGIYFLDSRTDAKTQAPATAREMKMTIWERAVFLDNAQDRESIEEAVTGGLKIAEKKGAAIMIGHIWSADLANILNEMYPELVSQGYSLSTIARIATEKDLDE